MYRYYQERLYTAAAAGVLGNRHDNAGSRACLPPGASVYSVPGAAQKEMGYFFL